MGARRLREVGRGIARRLIPTCFALLLTAAGPAAGAAAAEEPSVEQLAEARRHFEEGKAKMDVGEWVQAAQHFRDAAQVKDTPGLRYHVAFCAENAGHLLEALAEYEAAQRLLALRPAPDVEDLLVFALERLEEKLPELRLMLAEPPEPKRVVVDGEPIENWRVLRLDPGTHELRVEALGYEPFVGAVTLETGQRKTLQVSLKGHSTAPRNVLAEPPRAAWRMPVFVSGAAVSAAGLGFGVWGVFDRAAANKEVRWAQDGLARLSGGAAVSCVGATGSIHAACVDLDVAERRRDRATNVAVGGFVAAGVGATVAVASLFFWPESPVDVGVVTTAEETGVHFGGRF